MLNRLPTWLPNFDELCRDIGHTDARALGKALGVSASTVRRWRRTVAPRSALLALWWLSRWGESAWDCEMARRHSLHWTHAKATRHSAPRQRGETT